jgi:hypothetical protein
MKTHATFMLFPSAFGGEVSLCRGQMHESEEAAKKWISEEAPENRCYCIMPIFYSKSEPEDRDTDSVPIDPALRLSA